MKALFPYIFCAVTEVYLKPSRTSKMELFVEIVSSQNPLIIFGKRSILDV